ncbi:MAG: hypothetical protein J7L54_03190 [Elusimicrobia bacterium]|nr:hypothetical protein [Elusimicrobiota bacterium]
MNAKRVTRCSLGESGYASAGSAEECGGATAVKPWCSTIREFDIGFFLMYKI